MPSNTKICAKDTGKWEEMKFKGVTVPHKVAQDA